MLYNRTTYVPNILFDKYLAQLTESELKLLLVVIRQTFGWRNPKTGDRKKRDRISAYQFRQKTGLSKRVITKAIQSLVAKQLLSVTGAKGNVLNQPDERKGKVYLYYSFTNPVHLTTPTSAQNVPKPVHKGDHNKTNYTKLTKTKLRRGFSGHISNLIQQKKLFQE